MNHKKKTLKEISKAMCAGDFCSATPDHLFGIHLHVACEKHDQGYKKGGTGKDRKRIDQKFRDDLMIEAKKKKMPIRGWFISRVMYAGVRLFSCKAVNYTTKFLRLANVIHFKFKI